MIEFNQHFNGKIVKKEGYQTQFELMSNFKPTYKDLKQAQTKLGYDGVPLWATFDKLKNGKYRTHWTFVGEQN